MFCTHGIAFSFTSLRHRFGCCATATKVGDSDDLLFQTPTPPLFWSPPPAPLLSDVDMSNGTWPLADGCRFNMRPSLMLPTPSTWPLFSDVVMSDDVAALLALVCMMCRVWPSTGDLGALTEMGIGCCWLRTCDDVCRTLWF